ncbi:hypothetical protein [Enterococcus sp. AZ194]
MADRIFFRDGIIFQHFSVEQSNQYFYDYFSGKLLTYPLETSDN